MKIIDRVKTYFGQKKERDQRSAGDALDGAVDPAAAQHDHATDEQNRDDNAPAVVTAQETPEPEPAAEPVTESVIEPAPEPVIEPTPEPVTEPAPESLTEPVTEPAPEPVTESTTGPAADPIPVTTSATAPAACPRCGATGDAPCTTPAGKATKPHKGRVL